MATGKLMTTDTLNLLSEMFKLLIIVIIFGLIVTLEWLHKKDSDNHH